MGAELRFLGSLWLLLSQAALKQKKGGAQRGGLQFPATFPFILSTVSLWRRAQFCLAAQQKVVFVPTKAIPCLTSPLPFILSMLSVFMGFLC